MELIERYNELYETMAYSANPEKMKIFGAAEKWAFAKLAETNPKMAQLWLERLEPVDWNNYLSEEEAVLITSKFLNQDGTTGPLWSYGQVKSAVDGLGVPMEQLPFFNSFALWVTMNMLASDHLKTLKEFVPEADLPRVVYKLATEKLTDPDRPNFIREYFAL